jgi:hypothetical protein
MLQVNNDTYFKELQAASIKHLTVPVKDHTNNFSQGAAARTLAEMHETLSAGNKIYIHCKAGRSRSATLLASLYLIVAKDCRDKDNISINTNKSYSGYEEFIAELKENFKENSLTNISDEELINFVAKFLKVKRPQVDMKDHKEIPAALKIASSVSLEDINLYNKNKNSKPLTDNESAYNAFQSLEYKQLNHQLDSKEKREAVYIKNIFYRYQKFIGNPEKTFIKTRGLVTLRKITIL